MNDTSILIVEDITIEAAALQQRLELLGYRVAGSARSGKKALELFRATNPDMVIMDINLEGELDGIETAQTMQAIRPCPVIYLSDRTDAGATSRATESANTDYLLKPYSEQQLGITLNHAWQRFQQQAESSDTTAYSVSDAVFIPTNHGFEKVIFSDILYVEADRSYCNVYTAGKRYQLSRNSREVTATMEHPALVRVHRSFHVNLDAVDAIDGNQLRVGDATIPIGEKFKADVKDRFRIMRFGENR